MSASIPTLADAGELVDAEFEVVEQLELWRVEVIEVGRCVRPRRVGYVSNLNEAEILAENAETENENGPPAYYVVTTEDTGRTIARFAISDDFRTVPVPRSLDQDADDEIEAESR